MTEIINVGFKRLSDEATLPTKAHREDSGFDLYASEDVIIQPGDTTIIKTDISVELPEGYEAQIRPRSGITAETTLRVQLGTIDNGYRGELGVIVDNIALPEMRISTEYADYKYIELEREFFPLHIDGSYAGSPLETPSDTYLVRKGDRIAQLVIQQLPTVSSYEVEGDLEQTDRGEGGFGSSGV